MTLTEFLKNYCFRTREQYQSNNNYLIITEVIRRSDNKVVAGVKTSIDINETNDWISDSQTAISLIPWDWPKLIDQAKRAQLDYFAQRVPITDFFPLNTETNILNVYCLK
jgi:hypothetical protein